MDPRVVPAILADPSMLAIPAVNLAKNDADDRSRHGVQDKLWQNVRLNQLDQ